MQLEDDPIFMDVHINIPPTKENTGPMSVIATMSSRLLKWVQGIQEMDNSFKLHTVNLAYPS